jgi:hypothetical protein
MPIAVGRPVGATLGLIGVLASAPGAIMDRQGRVGSSSDSLLEEDGFELSVPPKVECLSETGFFHRSRRQNRVGTDGPNARGTDGSNPASSSGESHEPRSPAD